MELVRVSKENLGTWARQLQGLGLHRRAGGVPEDAVSDASAASMHRVAMRLTHRRRRLRARHASASRASLALEDVSFDDRRGLVPRAVRRERRRQEHARQDPRRHPSRRTRGRVLVDGARGRLRGPAARRSPPGIGMVHQELAFCENLSVAENLCLGSLPARGGVRVARARCARRADEMLAAIGADIDVRRRVGELTIGQQQMRADRRGGRQRRARHRLRRADEQPVAARGRAALRPDRPAARAGRHRDLRLAPAWRRSSGCATRSPCCATAGTSRRGRSRRARRRRRSSR